MPDAVGVVLLNLGGPEGEAQIPDFLRRLLGDPDVMHMPGLVRRPLARFIARRRAPKVAGHYKRIGGRSPIGAQTRAQVEALRSSLGDGWLVRYAFRHSPPFADAVVAGLAEAGVRRIVALPGYPHWSGSTTGSALKDLRRAAKPHGLQIAEAPSFPDGPGYIQALAERTAPLLSEGCHLLVSAHGLPAAMIRRGDPYVDEVNKTFAALRSALPAGTTMSLAFQSRLGPVEWTRPYLVDEIQRLADDGVRSLVVAPVSFVCENLETLYELDLEVAELAAEHGIADYQRVPVPGVHPAFIEELAGLVRTAAAQADFPVEATEPADEEVTHGA